jgi:hypothetical protein
MDAWGYLAVIGLCLIGLAWLLPNKQKKSAAPSLDDIERTLDAFSSELEEENKRFAEWLANFKHEHDERLAEVERRMYALEKQNEWLRSLLSNPELPAAPAAPAAEPAAPAPSAQPEGDGGSIEERYPELFEYYRQGKSTEQIARKLGMNKGEVMLILGLAKREARQHAPS